MKKINVSSFIIKDKFKYHEEIKKDLLSEINNCKESYNVNEKIDTISSTDWLSSSNTERIWVKKYFRPIGEQLATFAENLGYEGVKMHDIWFQQYIKNDTHTWHVHDKAYTGTYYLELPKDGPKTQFLFPHNLKKAFTVDVEEGDIIFFPCSLIHRSPPSESKKRKTIISWNSDLHGVNKDLYYDRPSEVIY